MLLSPWIIASVAQKIYGIPEGVLSTNAKTTQSVAEFDAQYYKPNDLTTFCDLMGVPEPAVDVRGKNLPLHAGLEATMDIQWIAATGENHLQH